jgi:hypothetical protein
MAQQSALDPKNRIIVHMNTDHTADLALYLKHHRALSDTEAATARLDDMTLSQLRITTVAGTDAASHTHTVPIEPAMESWADARPRMIAMTAAAHAALAKGERDATVRAIRDRNALALEYIVPPRALLAVLVCATLSLTSLALEVLASRGLGLAASLAALQRRGLDAWFPGGAEGYFWVQRWLVTPLWLLHLFEAVLMSWRLEKLGRQGRQRGVRIVRRCGAVWWLWVVETFLGGFGAHLRFGRAAKRALNEVEKLRKDE